MAVVDTVRAKRCGQCDPRTLREPAALIFNPHAGQKLGLDTNAGSIKDVQAALQSEGIRFDERPTERAGHATDLARQAVADGRQVVIVAGGDGTVNEVAHGLSHFRNGVGADASRKCNERRPHALDSTRPGACSANHRRGEGPGDGYAVSTSISSWKQRASAWTPACSAISNAWKGAGHASARCGRRCAFCISWAVRE
jgi:Diacylglycerol kinase catalytic domain